MIVDTLSNIVGYAVLGDGFKIAIEFLTTRPLAELADGRHEISEDKVFALVMSGDARPVNEAKLETHRKYIDIQLLLDGDESIGWSPITSCIQADADYDSEKDIQFFNDPPQNLIQLQPEQFAIFHPEDAHMPMIGQGHLHKIVIKIRRD